MLLGAIPLIPFVAFVLLLLLGTSLPRAAVSIIGVMGIAISSALSLICASQYTTVESVVLWKWIGPVNFAFYLDHLSLIMTCMITFVATCIAVFSVRFMDEEDDLARFFGSMNLFVASMLVLVLADNLLLLLLGWEGVGLCSYLLIGFWYKNRAAGTAATKAFITTRIGDVGLLVAMLFIVATLGELNIQSLQGLAAAKWPVGSIEATIVAMCLLFAATGKSAQIPLQTWLPDAMLGPTPVSALIHAATMVTAGVYLIARLSGIFALSPVAQMTVLVIGAATLLIAGFCALTQSDLKRVLAYSTMSQIGSMFLALGAGAYSAAMFHLLTHAFFKALLFLSAGVIGYCAHHEYDMFKLGGLRKTLPLAYYTFLVGALCLCALPLVTSGFYSKEFILSGVLYSVDGGIFAWAAGIVGALLTGLYTFRAIVITFHGEAKTPIDHKPGYLMAIPLTVLAVFSIGLGFLQTPELLGHVHVVSDWFSGLFQESLSHEGAFIPESASLAIASVVSLLGIFGGFYLYRRAKRVENVLTNGLGFDDLYGLVVVAPYTFLSRILRRDVFGEIAQSIARAVYDMAAFLGRVQTGRLSDYANLIAFSVVIIVAFLVFR
jgi:NADH-quinone oxidoreductase subunit L